MPTRREWLAERGLAKPGRGKFSTNALAELEKARKNGVTFSDDEKPVRVPREKKEKADKPKPVGIVSEVVYTYPEKEYAAVEKDTKVKRSMREVCNTCGVSLVAHGCLSPTIVARDASGPVAVSIIPVKG